MVVCLFVWPALWMFADVGTPHAIAVNEQVADMGSLVEQGRFDDVIALLQSDTADVDDPRARSLITDYEQHVKHLTLWQSNREKAYADALADVAKAIEEGDLDLAMVSVVEAHSLSVDRAETLTNAQVVDVVERVKSAAGEAEKTGDWIQALVYYRELNLLFEDQRTFDPQVKHAQRHVRLVRFYAPERFKQLFEARAKRLGQDERVNLGDEPWQQRLEGIKTRILRKMLRKTANSQVDLADKNVNGYEQLLTGAINALLVMIDNQALADTFESLKDPGKVNEFRGRLEDLQRDVRRQAHRLEQSDARSTIDRVLTVNRQTLELPEQVVIYEMADGALSTVDEFSTVIWPRDAEQFSRNTQGKFTGVGIQIALRNGRLFVVSPLANTPARTAGIQAGDIITKVDGQSTAAWTLDQAVRAITGPVSTTVVLTVDRKITRKQTALPQDDPNEQTTTIESPIRPDSDLNTDNDIKATAPDTDTPAVETTAADEDPQETAPDAPIEELSFAIVRKEIPIESVMGWERNKDSGWKYYIDRDYGIAYIRVAHFMPQTSVDLRRTITGLLSSRVGLRGVILDLRYNPGGLLRSAVEVADQFIASGPIVSTTGGSPLPLDARSSVTHPRIPMVVLINQQSASASEIVSGALQDHGVAIIIGERSFGKGSVQDVWPLSLPDDPSNPQKRAILKLTTQYYLLPKGRIIHRRPEDDHWGIEPDMLVEMTPQQMFDARDFRQELDVLRDNAGNAALAKPPVAATQVFEKALDPQLETALLVLKTQLFVEGAKLARKDAPVNTP